MSYGERLRRELLHRGLSPTSILSVAALTRHWSRRSLRNRRPQRNSKHQPLQRSTSQHRCSRSRRQHWEKRWVLGNSDDRMRIRTHPFSVPVKRWRRDGFIFGFCRCYLPMSVVSMPRGNVTIISRACPLACCRLYRLCSPDVSVLGSYNSMRNSTHVEGTKHVSWTWNTPVLPQCHLVQIWKIEYCLFFMTWLYLPCQVDTLSNKSDALDASPIVNEVMK